MANNTLPTSVADCSGLVASKTTTDKELLRRFLAGDQHAFSEIVSRHAPLVSGVCRRVLFRSCDAEDAFQATFLVLARRAGDLEWNDSIAGWLHQTARRTAMKLRSRLHRQRCLEGAAHAHLNYAPDEPMDPTASLACRELSEMLDAELNRLPEKLRDVILLSQVEGLSRDEVAERLGISSSQVKERLERGRERLRARLVERGVSLLGVSLATWLAPTTAQAATVSSALIATTSQAATAFTTGQLGIGTLPMAVSLAKEILKMMGLGKVKSMGILVLSLITAGSVALGMLKDEPERFNKGLRGTIVDVRLEQPAAVTIALDEYDTLLNLNVSEQAEVWVAYEKGALADLAQGQFVSLRLADDHRTVNNIHVQGNIRLANIESISKQGEKIEIAYSGDDDDSPLQKIELAPDAILRIGGLPAAADDLVPGMEIPFEFNRNASLVNAIEVEASEEMLVRGGFVGYDQASGKLTLELEDDNDARVQRTFAIVETAKISLDGVATRLPFVPVGADIILRLSPDQSVVQAIQATTPLIDDEGEAD